MCVSSLNIYHPIQVTSTSLLQPMTTGHLVQSQSGMSWELNELPWFLLGWFSMFGNAFWASSPECFMENIGLKVGITIFQTIFFEKKTAKGKDKKGHNRILAGISQDTPNCLLCLLTTPNPSLWWMTEFTNLTSARAFDIHDDVHQ